MFYAHHSTPLDTTGFARWASNDNNEHTNTFECASCYLTLPHKIWVIIKSRNWIIDYRRDKVCFFFSPFYFGFFFWFSYFLLSSSFFFSCEGCFWLNAFVFLTIFSVVLVIIIIIIVIEWTGIFVFYPSSFDYYESLSLLSFFRVFFCTANLKLLRFLAFVGSLFKLVVKQSETKGSKHCAKKGALMEGKRRLLSKCYSRSQMSQCLSY